MGARYSVSFRNVAFVLGFAFTIALCYFYLNVPFGWQAVRQTSPSSQPFSSSTDSPQSHDQNPSAQEIPAKTSTYQPSEETSASTQSPTDAADCKSLPGAEDVLVILKTGASEAREKLLVHFDTTFRCTPHFAVFSNVDEVINGHHVRDALSEIPHEIQEANEEFQLYRKLQEHSHEGGYNYSAVLSKEQGAKEDNPAWKLDKWKFLPLLDKALEVKPDAKWYIFMEADTALVWPNLLEWLAMFDSKTPYYLGGQAYFGDNEFAHGGAGYVLSRQAIQMATAMLRNDPLRYHRVSEDCCGDLILAKVLKQLDIRLTRSWPIIQGETPSSLDYSNRHWCHPVVSYHHMRPAEIESLWRFQQSWILNNTEHMRNAPILHRDAFEHFVQPLITPRKGWDNISKDHIFTEKSENMNKEEEEAYRDASACHALCRSRSECMQYTYVSGTCKLGDVVRLGEYDPAHPDEVSGWMNDKIEEFKKSLHPCTPHWITSN